MLENTLLQHCRRALTCLGGAAAGEAAASGMAVLAGAAASVAGPGAAAAGVALPLSLLAPSATDVGFALPLLSAAGWAVVEDVADVLGLASPVLPFLTCKWEPIR